MSDFEKLYESLRERVDSDNDSFIGVTEDGVEFNMYEHAFFLAVGAKHELDTLRQQNAELVEKVEKLTSYNSSLAKQLNGLRDMWSDEDEQ